MIVVTNNIMKLRYLYREFVHVWYNLRIYDVNLVLVLSRPIHMWQFYFADISYIIYFFCLERLPF